MTAIANATDPEVREELVATVRRWIARDVIPVASDLEHADEYPAQMVEQMKELGLFGITIPEQYGGLGLDLLTYIGVVEELAYGWMSLSGIVNTHTIAAHLIVHNGTEAQKQQWLPRLATGELRGCLSLSEADAGSDTRNIACRARRDGDEYVVDGTKFWVTNGERAGLVALAARTDEGISCFIVEKEPGPKSGGLTVSKNIPKLGYKGIETVEMSYVEHRVPADALLGDAGRGLSYILGALEVGRINIAARAVGVSRAAFDAALAYAQQRTTFGKPIAQHQAIQMKLADMATKLEAARLLTRSAAERKQSGERADVEAGMAKLFASETAFELATESLRIHGGVGYTTELPVERYYRDAPLMIIGEGTNEIQRLVIARGLLAARRRRHPMKRVLAVVAIAALVLAACGGDDDSSSKSSSKSGSTTTDDTLAEADYVDLFASSISGENNPFGATAAEAKCVAKGAVAKVGADRLQEAGLTKSWFGASAKPATTLTQSEADAVVDAFYGCYDVTERFMQSRAGQKLTPQQQACVAPDTTIHDFLPRVLREGGSATLTEPQASALVDTLFKCVPVGEIFRNAVAGSLKVTDAQVACLDVALLSSPDYRNALIQAQLGKVDSSKTPAYADEVAKCIKLG